MCSITDTASGYLDRYCVEDMANDLGRSESYTYRKLNPNDGECQLKATEIPMICNGRKDYALLYSISLACGHTCVKTKTDGQVDLPKFTKEIAEALLAVSDAMADGAINSIAEANRCIPELMDVIRVASTLAKQCQDILSDEQRGRVVKAVS